MGGLSPPFDQQVRVTLKTVVLTLDGGLSLPFDQQVTLTLKCKFQP